jgi:Holliday junction resolvase-like predicted endonuclease
MPPYRTPYMIGRDIEYRAKQRLEQMGFVVVRMAASKGPMDLVAIHPATKEIWLVQVKKGHVPLDPAKVAQKFRDLRALAGQYTVRAMVYTKRGDKYRFEEV